jgi:hypothetical protein
MRSQTRIDCDNAIIKFANTINSKSPGNNYLLYVGIAGDPPGGEYTYLFPNWEVATFDKDPKWNPILIGDITNTKFEDELCGCVVMTQVIEHIPNLWDLPKELDRIICKDGYLVIDCPWMYPYHAEPPSFGDFWRISADGFKQLFKDTKLQLIDLFATNNNTSCLFKHA